MRSAAQRRAGGIRRVLPTPHSRQRPRILDLEIALLRPERQPARQIAIGAGRMDRDRLDAGHVRVEAEIDQRNIDLRALIVLALRGPARRIPETVGPLALTGMAIR